MHRAKLLLVGFDGLDHNLVERYRSDMPTLSRMAEQGWMTRISSTCPPVTPGAWASICSGVNPGRTGFLGFFIRKGYAFEPVALQRSPARALWDYGQEQGLSCGIINVPWPGHLPDHVRFGISGRFTPLEVLPASWKDELPRVGYRPEVRHPSEFRSLSVFLRFALQQAEGCTRATLHAIQSHRPDICMVVYNLPDMALHAMLTERMIRRVYRHLDRTLAALLPHGEHHLVVSDHGIGITRGPVFYFGEWLLREGHLTLRSRGGAPSSRERIGTLLRALLLRLRLGSLKKRVPQFIRNAFPPGIAYPAFLPVDHGATRAFLGPGEFCDLFLNVRGREPDGTVQAAEVETTLAEMARRLRTATDTPGNRPVRLVPARELYHGDRLDQLPDAVIQDPGSWHLEPGLRPAGPAAPNDVKHEHNQHGVLALSGQAPIRPVPGAEAALVDVLPTALALAGLAVPEGLDGRCLIETPDGRPVRTYDTPLVHDASPSSADLTAEEEAEVMDRLRKLGYL